MRPHLAATARLRQTKGMAKLYFCYAAMNAGKSTLLLQASWNYQERGMRTLLLTSALYRGEDDGRITSRIGIKAAADLYGEGDDLYARIRRAHARTRVDCVFVDEAQFLAPDQVWQLARVADRLDIPVMCFGLRTDFRGRLFPGSAELLAIADSLREIRTICHCGRKATMVVRQDEAGYALQTGDQVGIEKAQYVSLCRRHWEEEMGRWPVKSADRKTSRAPARPAAKKAAAKASSKASAPVAKRPARGRA
jgi:thymidine kinase